MPRTARSSRLGLALAVIASAQLMVVLDATIVNVALPHVQRALGLGGLLTTYVSWRWVLFVNVPIGLVVAAAAHRVLAESPRRPGPIDVAGAVTGTAGVALLVYGLSKAATGPDGVSHWGDALVLASLAAAAALIVSFVLIEARSSHPLLPMRILADRNRSGAYLIMLCIGTAMFGMFFFLTLFTQTVLGYSAVRSGICYLPFTAGIVIAAGLASQLMARIGPRPLILAGTAAAAGGMFWFARLTEHATYPGQLLGLETSTVSGHDPA
jgi:MFS family permease